MNDSKSLKIMDIITGLKNRNIMSKLIIPDKSKHQYVVGIDFGHGETSAAICEMEWDKTAGQRENKPMDLDMDRRGRKKVIPSAICRVKDQIFIGEEAFEHTTDNDGIRLGFKQKPLSLEGEAENLMVDYMRAVYGRIREVDYRLTDTNHIVYIARPSGWQDEEAKELYRQMALKAGIPLSGLTSESRAAIFYARSPKVGFANEISKGAIVFDLGSSTVDFTYLSDKDKPIDNGYDMGASIIDNTIFHSLVCKSDKVKEFLSKYPEYEGALIFEARKFKEKAFSRNPESKTIGAFFLEPPIIAVNDKAYAEYGDVCVKLTLQNLQELNDLIEKDSHYISRLRNALADYREHYIKDKTVNGVFLTGGASRMNFIHPMVSEILNLSPDKVKYDNDNPSLTISRGIALLGATDAVSSVLVNKLKVSIPEFLTDAKLFDPLVDALSDNISTAAWSTVEDACNHWIKNGSTTKRDELKKEVQKSLENFKNYSLNQIVNETVHNFIGEERETIRREMNKVISLYVPGREISMKSSNVRIRNHEGILKSIQDMSAIINTISMSVGSIIAEILWKALAIYLFGIFTLPYYALKYFLTSDESKRKDKAKDIISKKSEITSNVRSSIRFNLTANSDFKSQITKTLKDYFTKVIDENLQQVIIPIE